MIQSAYPEIRHLVRPGDLIAFGGRGLVSDVIRWTTRSPVSHVGIVVGCPPLLLPDLPEEIHYGVMEARNEGVVMARLSERVLEYDGRVWWLPLSEAVRAKLDLKAFHAEAQEMLGKRYDFVQAVGSVMPGWLWHALEGARKFVFRVDDDRRMFCSEVAAAVLRAGGYATHEVPARITPAEIVAAELWGEATQLKGAPLEIGRPPTGPTPTAPLLAPA
jgi:hypothetical protein